MMKPATLPDVGGLKYQKFWRNLLKMLNSEEVDNLRYRLKPQCLLQNRSKSQKKKALQTSQIQSVTNRKRQQMPS
jgi:hypothetical protein